MGALGIPDENPLQGAAAAAIAGEEVEALPDDVYTQPLHLHENTAIPQRISQPEYQPSLTSRLYPQHTHLLIKRSQRCKTCEHNLSKPEYNPTSIKFKIQLNAYYHIPEIRLLQA